MQPSGRQLNIATMACWTMTQHRHQRPQQQLQQLAAAERGCVPSVCPVGGQHANRYLIDYSTCRYASGPNISRPTARQPASEFLCWTALSDRKLIPPGQNVTETFTTSVAVHLDTTMPRRHWLLIFILAASRHEPNGPQYTRLRSKSSRKKLVTAQGSQREIFASVHSQLVRWTSLQRSVLCCGHSLFRNNECGLWKYRFHQITRSCRVTECQYSSF